MASYRSFQQKMKRDKTWKSFRFRLKWVFPPKLSFVPFLCNSQSRVSCFYNSQFRSRNSQLTQITQYDPTHAKVVLYKTKKEVQQKPRKYHVISFLSVNNSYTLALLNITWSKMTNQNPSTRNNVGGQWWPRDTPTIALLQ